MFNFKSKGAPVAPQTKEALGEQLSKDQFDLKATLTSLSDEITKLKHELETASMALYGTKIYNRKPNYWALIGLIAAMFAVSGGEINFNYVSFQWFRMGSTATQVTAISFGLLTAWLSHYAGKNLKRSICNPKDADYRNSYRTAIWVATLLFIATTCLRMMQKHDDSVGEMIFSFLIQLIITNGIFWAGVLASKGYTSKAKNPESEHTFKSELKRLKSLESEFDKLIQKNKDLQRKYADDLASIIKAEQDAIKNGIAAKANSVNNANATAAKNLVEFDGFEQKFEEALINLEKRRNLFIGKAKDLDFDGEWLKLKADAKLCLAEAKKVSSTETEERLQKMNNDFSTFING